jgi:pre-mRNA-splicing factor ATP-dependent RNA helicase DHX15/PRP43
MNIRIVSISLLAIHLNRCIIDLHDRNWARTNFLSQRSLVEADNIRSQLLRIMERLDIAVITKIYSNNPSKQYINIQKALVCGFFMQVAHKESEKNMYLTVKDNQVCRLVWLFSCQADVLAGGFPASVMWT